MKTSQTIRYIYIYIFIKKLFFLQLHLLTNLLYIYLKKIQLKTRNGIGAFSLTYCWITNYTSMSTVFGSSDERVFLILLPSEISNRSHGTEVTGVH